MATDIYTRYFMFSQEQADLKKTMDAKRGKVTTFGTVIVRGGSKVYTEIVTDPTNIKFSDSILVTSGDLRKIQYTQPSK